MANKELILDSPSQEIIIKSLKTLPFEVYSGGFGFNAYGIDLPDDFYPKKVVEEIIRECIEKKVIFCSEVNVRSGRTHRASKDYQGFRPMERGEDHGWSYPDDFDYSKYEHVLRDNLLSAGKFHRLNVIFDHYEFNNQERFENFRENYLPFLLRNDYNFAFFEIQSKIGLGSSFSEITLEYPSVYQDPKLSHKKLSLYIQKDIFQSDWQKLADWFNSLRS